MDLWYHHGLQFLVCPAIPFRVFVSTQILHLSTHTERGLFLSRHSQILLFIFNENVCQPSFLHSKLRSMRTPLSHLQMMIDGQESRRALDKMSKLHRSRLDTSFCTRRSGPSQLASNETLSMTACPRTELHCKPTRSVDQLREMCPSPSPRSSAHRSVDVRVDTVIGVSAGGSETNVTAERDNDFTAKTVRDMNAEVEGRKPRMKKAPPQPTIVYNTVNISGAASSAPIS